MIRDLAPLASGEFDVLVVGGGIYGLTVAYDAAQRGLSVALVERGDFGAATSFNHLKTIHGGLRYLQSMDLRRMRQSIRERRAFALIAPRYVAPLAFAMATGPSLTRNPIAMKAALAIDAFIGRGRNDRVDPARHLPAGRVIAGHECREVFEGALRTVASAAMWHDYQTVDGDRLTLSFAKAAASNGAMLANYTETAGPVKGSGALRTLRARDNLTGDTFDIRARIVVNAAGPWAATILDASGVRAPWPLLKAMNLVTSRPARKTAVVAQTRAGRALVLLPWQGRTLVGTAESRDERQADDQDARCTEVDEFLTVVNETFPSLGLKAGEVTLVHRGIVPAARNNGGLSLLTHSRIVDHSDVGVPALLSVIGVKYTTARLVAEQAVDLIARKLGRRLAPCRTADTVLPGAAVGDQEPSDPVLSAIRHEMAHTLTDVVVRRTALGAAGYPGDAVANEIASRMQTELAWSDDKKTREVGTLRKFYEIT